MVVSSHAYLPVHDPAWMTRAACRAVDPEMFFPDHGNASTAAAKRVCRQCDVGRECLQTALSHDERGVWGGMTERERRKIKRRAE